MTAPRPRTLTRAESETICKALVVLMELIEKAAETDDETVAQNRKWGFETACDLVVLIDSADKIDVCVDAAAG
jgi:hypothetical protein